MLEYGNGIIGFPLRLLAREVYDKVVKIVGHERVALVTGEENNNHQKQIFTFVPLSPCLKILILNLLQ